MRRRSPINIDVKQDRWLVSYSDFVTLLFAFFVVMYSISQVSEGKYRVLSSTLLEAFSVPQSAINPIQVGDPTTAISPSAIEVFEKPEQGNQEHSGFEDENLQQLEENVNEQFVDLIDDRLLKVNSNELWLELELNSNVLFPTASADPSLQAKGIFEEIAAMLSDYSNIVQVEGFTDNVPINNRRYNSNWELSAARAASVVKLLANNGVNPVRLSAVGRGEFQPVADNSTEEGRSQNRRVVVMISKQAQERPSVGNEGIEDVLVTEPELAEEVGETESILDDMVETPAAEEEISLSDSIIAPVELNNGGLLFTSDPELQRNNLSFPNDADDDNNDNNGAN